MKRMFTVSFWQDQGVCNEEAPPIDCCVIPVFAWEWVKGQVSSDCIYSIIDDLDVCVPFSVCLCWFLNLPFSPHLLPRSPVSCIHTHPVLHWLPCVGAKQCGHCTPVTWSYGAILGKNISLTFDLLLSISLELKTTNCSVILLVTCSLYFL